MGNVLKRKTRTAMIRRPFLVKGLAVIFFFCLIIRLAVHLGSDTLAEGIISRLMENDAVVIGILDFELGGAVNFGLTPDINALLFASPPPPDADFEPDTAAAAVPEVRHEPDENPPDAGLYHHAEQIAAEDNAEDFRYVGNSARNADGIMLTNTTTHELDVAALLAEPLNITLTHGEPAVLILHTHTSEAFTPSDGLTYIASDPYRTEDQTRNITRVGEELAAEFERLGIGVIHDRRSYDFPSFTGSYSRAYRSIRSYLERYPSIRLVLDIHRDSITAPDGSQRKTIAHIGDVVCSQIMLVVGTNHAGLNHPQWHENLKLALRLQYEMNAMFPSLARPIFISQFRFNQQATTGSLIVEVGSAGNSLTESLYAVRFFAEAAANVILSLYE